MVSGPRPKCWHSVLIDAVELGTSRTNSLAAADLFDYLLHRRPECGPIYFLLNKSVSISAHFQVKILTVLIVGND